MIAPLIAIDIKEKITPRTSTHAHPAYCLVRGAYQSVAYWLVRANMAVSMKPEAST